MSGSEVLAELNEVIDRLAGLDPTALAGPGREALVVGLFAARDRLAGVAASATAAWEASDDWAGDGSKACWARLALISKCSPTTARREVNRARSLRALPAVATALRAGTLPLDRADLLARARVGREPLMARDETHLLDVIAGLTFPDASRAVQYWAQQADEALGRDPWQAHRDVRSASWARTFENRVDLRALLDPIDGTIVITELERLEKLLLDQDLAGPDGAGARASWQRRADALVEMARRSAAATASARGRPLFSVLIGYETFAGRICQFADGSPVHPDALRAYLLDADIERIVFDGPSRVIDVGVAHRFFTGATRRAIEVRDQHCAHPGCDIPATACQIDHLTPYSHGGPTTQTNGQARCAYHNRWHYQHQQRTRAGPDP